LQAVTVLVFDGVLLVIEDRAQTFVKMGNVIAAVEIVIDVDLPVAVNFVAAAVEVVKFSDGEGCDAIDEAAEKSG
jgi:hypothetical protein